MTFQELRRFVTVRLALASLIALSVATTGTFAAAKDGLPPISLPEQYESNTGDGTPVSNAPWWSVFGDPQLASLIERLHAANTTIAQARARLAAAEAAARAGRASQGPFASVDASATSVQGPLINAAGESGNLYSGRMNVSWEVDVLDRLSGERAAERLDASAAAALLEDAKLLMEGRVVRTWLSLKALSAAQIDADRAVRLLQEASVIMQRRRDIGQVALQEVDTAQSRLKAALQHRSDLQLSHATAARELGFLLGETTPIFPAAAAEPTIQLPQIAAGLPSELLVRRPDIAAARSHLMAADQRLVSARRGWLPTFGLTASGGAASSSLGQILSGGAASLLLGALFSIPVLDGARQKARIAGRDAEVALADARYRETVLSAVRDVNNHLQAYNNCKTVLSHANEQEQSASSMLAAANGRAKNGTIGRLALIDVEIMYIERTSAQIFIQTICYHNLADVLQSLGRAT
ncbi:TolC family protein [Novosphingobium sp. ERN07]|uniref:TolC family protein n=1 Tax=Novosphingobium sp. ERN07 TaxID=2726187 RepID=UPI001F0E5695|nr:TolC family protein [Novosphingobium sp. ERN07]